MKSRNRSLRVIIFRETDTSSWQAQCLEHDIATQAPTLLELRKRLDATIRLEIEEGIKIGIEPLSDIPEAPNYFYKMWDRRYGYITPEEQFQPLQHEVSLEQAIFA